MSDWFDDWGRDWMGTSDDGPMTRSDYWKLLSFLLLCLVLVGFLALLVWIFPFRVGD
jgi:disulfide bond formation protein DsbB